ncbi:tape measure protein [Microbacterium sp. Marseille-Q6965]|uniref:tape measure protein n=1 Tax=Microbacterium sp. Marseille-Q6965 TaxID=2965072 RepID=UPI0021B74A1C|nr:tape measure protein [Microbacterium sp. Marseille-Q6965]
MVVPEIGSTWVTVAPSAKGFGKELDRQVSGEAERSGSNAGSLFGAAFAASAVVGTAVVAGVGMLGKAGVAFNAEMQNFEAGFTSLLGSGEAAQDMLEELTSFAAATPFEMPTLANSATMLSQFGIAAEEILPSLQMLGDISMGDSDKLERLSRVFGQVSSAGRLTLEDVNQMIDAGFNPLGQIAATTGESMQELRDRVSAGEVSFGELSAAMQTATAEGGQFYDAMQNASRTLSGQWSTLQDSGNILAGTISGGLTDSLTNDFLPGLNTFTNALDGLLNNVAGVESSFDSADAALLDGIAGLGAGLQDFLGNVSTLFHALAPVASDANQALIEGFVAGLPELAASATPLIMELVNGILASFPALVTSGMGILTAILQGLAAAAPQIITTVATIIPQMITAFLASLPMVLQAGISLLDGILQGLLVALPILIAALPQIITAITTYLMTALPMLMDAGLQLLSALVTAMPQIIGTIVAVLPQIIAALTTFFVQSLPMIVDAGITLLVALVNAMPQIISGIAAALPQIISALVRFFTGPALPSIIDAGVKLLIALIDNLPRIISTIVGALPQIISGIVGAFANAGPQMVQAGVDLLMGLAVGIGQAAGRVIDQALQVAGDVLDNIKSFFGIQSPSREMREIGEFLDAGLAQGIYRGERGVLGAADALSGKVQGAFQGMSAGVDFTARAVAAGAALRMPAPAVEAVGVRDGVEAFSGELALVVGDEEFAAYVVRKASGVVSTAATPFRRGRR